MKRKINILILENETADWELMEHEIKNGAIPFESRCVSNREDFLHSVDEFNPDIILGDYNMPQFTGMEAFRLLKESKKDIPFILVTGSLSEEIAVQFVKEGLADYVLKSNIKHLSTSIINVLKKKNSEDEKNRTIENLKQSEERFQAVTRATSDVVWDWDLTTDLLYWNENFTKHFGYGKEECEKDISSWYSRIHPEDSDRVVSDIKKTVKSGGQYWSDEYRFRKSDGSYAYVLDRGYVIHDEKGSPVRMVGAMLDLTQLKSLESQLLQAQRMEAVGLLAGGIAHDFNNLLTAILGYSELLLNSHKKDDPRYGEINEIKNAAERASSLTQQLLAFGRKQILQLKVIDLNSVVNDIYKMIRRLIGEHIEPELKTEPDLWKIKADPVQIEQVIMNLAVNSHDAMPKGGKFIIRTENVNIDKFYSCQNKGLMPGNYVLLSVEDTGTGMSKEVQNRIFEPFYTTKEKGKGTGLGLSTAYGIVKQTGGNIFVYSEVGRGTVFKIYFPSVSPHAEGNLRTEERERYESGPGLPEGSETILLVEDDDYVRKLIREMLEAIGYTVFGSKDAEEALHISEQYNGEIHLVFTDVVIPKLSAREMVDKIRNRRKTIGDLYTSGYTDFNVAQRGLIRQGAVFLQKPFTAELLRRKVREALEAVRHQQSARKAA